jgi:hypothetical protein
MKLIAGLALVIARPLVAADIALPERAAELFEKAKGRRYFALIVANSGGVVLDDPPTCAIIEGRFGNQPLLGTRWVTVAVARDQQPEQGGIPAMQRTAPWIKEHGADVCFSIEDPAFGHGALQLNPDHARRVLDLFFAEKP